MMHRLPFILAAPVLLAAFAVHADTDDPFKDVNCKTATVQAELNYCADRDFQAADRKLNALYRKLLNAAGAGEQQRLKVSERKWIAYRDRECNEETAPSEGGSIAPMEYSTCLKEKTEARIKELARRRN